MKTTFLALAVLVAPPPAAQTVVTPPRSITSQQETTGNDSTFQGDVQPNTQASGFTVPIPTAPAPTPTPAPAPTPTPPPPAKKYGACVVTSPNGPDVSNVLYDLTTNHVVEADFDSAPMLTPAQQAEITGSFGSFCVTSVTIYYDHVYPSAVALAAGYASSDYLETWDTYPDPAFPAGPVW